MLAVILYHAGVGWAQGGFLGVEVFFVLSGFLITSLLVGEWRERGTIALRAFWARRARRLLPALFLMVVGIGIYYAVAGVTVAIPGILGDGLAALFYYSNWHQIANATTYFGATGRVSPFQHTWSLSIEEQFYVIWPLLLLAALALPRILRRVGGSPREPLRVLLGVAIAGTVLSWLEMLVLLHSSGVNRVYYGSDTRASGLLTGAVLAIWLALHQERLALHEARDGADADEFDPGPLWRVQPRWATKAHVSIFSGLILLLLLIAINVDSGTAAWMYPWGLMLVDLATAMTIAVIIQQPRSIAGGLMGLRPLRAIGVISYGLYLWHFPLFLWLDNAATGLSGFPLLIVRLLATFTLSTLSYFLIEQPIRRQRPLALPRRAPRTLTPIAPATAASTRLAAGHTGTDRRGRRPVAVGAGAAGTGWLGQSIIRWAPLGASLAVASLLVASAAGALPSKLPNAADLRPPANLQGTDPPCTVSLGDGSWYGMAPVADAGLSQFVLRSLDSHAIAWSGSGQKTFNHCPPTRVMMVGDSLAFTLATPMLSDEQDYGVEMVNAAMLGCAFGIRGELDVGGTWEPPSDGCPNALVKWSALANGLNVKAVVVELGYRDEFDWLWNGQIVHLGEPVFDRYVLSRIEQYVRYLGDGGKRKILFLSVPYVDPPAQSNGAPAPAAAVARHTAINGMLAQVAKANRSNVSVLDIDKTISPGNQYDADVDGQLCRFDGIHFTTFCAKLLEPSVLSAVRALTS